MGEVRRSVRGSVLGGGGGVGEGAIAERCARGTEWALSGT